MFNSKEYLGKSNLSKIKSKVQFNNFNTEKVIKKDKDMKSWKGKKLEEEETL